MAISIHSLRVGARRADRVHKTPQPRDFNPLAPRGSETNSMTDTEIVLAISIHSLRVGARLLAPNSVQIFSLISIHSLRVGARRFCLAELQRPLSISIHSLRVGARRLISLLMPPRMRNFNPLAPRGSETLYVPRAYCYIPYFNPLAPRGSETGGLEGGAQKY